MKQTKCLPLSLALLLGGCTLGPNFQPPAPPAGSAYNNSAPGVARNAPNPNWWAGFNDPVLTSLMREAIAGSPSLQEALLRVEQAHENVVTSRAAGLPTLGATGSFKREQEGLKGLAESGGAYSQLNQLAQQANSISSGSGTTLTNGASSALDSLGQPINLYSYSLSSSWELDLFGKVRRQVEAAKANADEANDAARESLVMLESQIAQAYFQLRAAQAALAQQQQNVQATALTLHLTQSQAAHGLAPQSDVEQARTAYLGQQAKLPTYIKQVAQDMTQIDILTGKPPGALDAQLAQATPLPTPPALIGTGVPASLARRRPDIREAEDNLHAATAQIGVAVASFYPDISLTGSVGFHALDASYLTNWANLFYAFGPSISLPIFEGGKLSSNLRLARISQANAALQYRATVLNALAEVENALVAYREDQQALTDAQGTAQAAQISFNLAQSRYQHGLASLLPALQAQDSLVSANQQEIQAQAQLDVDAATLYTALGGGWQESEQAVTPPPINAAPPIAPGAADTLADPR
ncbi:efflux transporter outer membrane subunit [Acidocella facilis]|uniref:efflux transporter outer membrane subunit n=1 Tax=Acidocella facilis TaxID=525 RepID=UPI001F38B6D6|nr:efflux transporter outer membrane subunit [Acidocella facilis]